jgi:agmatine/peptidylarginine deiminase
VTVDNNRSRSIPLSIFRDYYGCKNTIRLPYEKGIGHVDESIRFARSKTVFTDSETYEQILRDKNFDVIRLPRPTGEYETYVNSLLVNGTMFVPIYGESTDQEAVRVYTQAGFKVVPIRTNTLSNEGLGSLHCITMTYPPVPFSQLLKSLGAVEL